jgi:hypothetical protein
MIINLIANRVKATSKFFSINCDGFERERLERAKPFPPPLAGMLKAGNTANIAGFYFFRLLSWITTHMAVVFRLSNKQSVLRTFFGSF